MTIFPTNSFENDVQIKNTAKVTLYIVLITISTLKIWKILRCTLTFHLISCVSVKINDVDVCRLQLLFYFVTYLIDYKEDGKEIKGFSKAQSIPLFEKVNLIKRREYQYYGTRRSGEISIWTQSTIYVYVRIQSYITRMYTNTYGFFFLDQRTI